MFRNSRFLAAATCLSLGFVAAFLWASQAGPRSVIFPLASADEPASGTVADAAHVEYVTRDEVRKVCERLRIRDWSQLKSPEVEESEAKAIMAVLKIQESDAAVATFLRGLTVELEHGLKFQDANISNNHPLLTGKIVAAHLREFADYYLRLDVLEIEGDLHKAIVAGNSSELADLYRKLARARRALAESEARQLTK